MRAGRRAGVFLACQSISAREVFGKTAKLLRRNRKESFCGGGFVIVLKFRKSFRNGRVSTEYGRSLSLLFVFGAAGVQNGNFYDIL